MNGWLWMGRNGFLLITGWDGLVSNKKQVRMDGAMGSHLGAGPWQTQWWLAEQFRSE
jgi:hypothetical protein